MTNQELIQNLTIDQVTREQMAEIIETRRPLGLFYRVGDGGTIGCDNSTGEAWVAEFEDEGECKEWLRNGPERGAIVKGCREMPLTEELQRIKQQGVGGFLPEVTDEEFAKARQKMSGPKGGIGPYSSELRRVVEWAHGIADSLSKNACFDEQERQIFRTVRDGIINRVRDKGMVCAMAEMDARPEKEKEMEAQLIAALERIEQLEFEREEVRKMRTAQKTFFKSPQGSAARNTALEESKQLERWVDTALEPVKPTAATLFG